ncbi:MAG TPA: hypothetical protein VEE83_00835 [Thermoplasmata archaeon]|nr:hypothetical protein [Thermoplasmata archaeon]
MQAHSKVVVVAVAILVVASAVAILYFFHVGPSFSGSGSSGCSPSARVANATFCEDNVTVTSCPANDCAIPPPGFTFRGVLFQFTLLSSVDAAGLVVTVTEESHPNESGGVSWSSGHSPPLETWLSLDRQVFVQWNSADIWTNPNGTISSYVLCGVEPG